MKKKNCSTCKHSPVDEHCKGCRGEKDGNTHWEQEPFINKPCISEGVCHEDKMNVLNKIRTEIEQEYNRLRATRADETLELGECLGLKMSLQIIDKYRKEQE